MDSRSDESGNQWDLTNRERQVLLILSDGATSAQIAHAFGLSTDTVDQHIESARGKMGARNRIELAALAVKEELVVDDAAARPVVWEVTWEAESVVSSVTPRYLGRAAIRRFSGMASMLDRPFTDWMADWREKLGPALDVLPLLEPGGPPISVDGVRIVIPDTGIEFEWSARIEVAGHDRYLLVIPTPLP